MTAPIRVTEDKKYLIISRCDFMYPNATEDEAGPRDERRRALLDGNDGDIVLRFAEGAWGDVADAETILKELFTPRK